MKPLQQRRVAYNSAKSFGAGMGLDDVIKDLSLRFKESEVSSAERRVKLIQNN